MLPPNSTRQTAFCTKLLDLPSDLQSQIFVYLAPDDLGVLSRSVPELEELEADEYLRRIWFQQVRHSLRAR